MSEDRREELRQIYQSTDTKAAAFIPAKPKVDIYGDGKVFRVCAYCRVSTGNDEQLSSFELQQQHYKQLVDTHGNWELKHIYADEGISGTSLKNRDDFNRMIAACQAGEYDLIVTKSVSRFARNLVDCISLVRKLKHQNPPVGVFFETDNLNTLSEDSEFMLSFLATFAQEESVKKRESMNWSLENRFKTGKLLTPALLGYERPRDAGGNYIKYARLQVVESEARIVRFIFDSFLAGYSKRDIANLLTDIDCPTKIGNTEWNEGSIDYILRNERYCGNVLTWKTFTADMFEHKHKKNQQDRNQYLYTNHHDAIITVSQFEAVQTLLANRRHHMRGPLPRLQVIDDGIFRGFIPINHHWINDDPATYYDISNSIGKKDNIRRIKRSHFSVFNFEGYQVVRGQFLSARADCPCITIANGKIAFNIYCMKKFEGVEYVQLLLHPNERKIAIRPCRATDTHSIKWRPDPTTSKVISCPHFLNALFQIMEWYPDYAYRIRGTWAKRAADELIVFPLQNAEPGVYLEGKETMENKHKRRTMLCPDEWGDTFGVGFYEHALDNSFYFLAPHTDWNAGAKSIDAPGFEQVDTPSMEDLKRNLEQLKIELEETDGE